MGLVRLVQPVAVSNSNAVVAFQSIGSRPSSEARWGRCWPDSVMGRLIFIARFSRLTGNQNANGRSRHILVPQALLPNVAWSAAESDYGPTCLRSTNPKRE